MELNFRIWDENGNTNKSNLEDLEEEQQVHQITFTFLTLYIITRPHNILYILIQIQDNNDDYNDDNPLLKRTKRARSQSKGRQ